MKLHNITWSEIISDYGSLKEDPCEWYLEFLTPNTTLEKTINLLKNYSIEMDFDGLSLGSVYILVTEACNWAAKTLNYSFYDFKEDLIKEAIEFCTDLEYGSVQDSNNEIIYLGNNEVGTASFHVFWNYNVPEWPWEWSGVYRQSDAFDLLIDEELRKHFVEVEKESRLRQKEIG
jgi:hypothetical protein